MEKRSQKTDYIISGLVLLLIILLAGIVGDYYFDLNDDVFMKDILSGAYTGVPESRNIQMLYPISLFISTFYKVVRGLDWYGIFLCVCQFFCIFLICKRTISFNKELKSKIVLAASVAIGILGTILPHLLFVQYTFTCGLLSATAAYIILTHSTEDKKDLILSVVLVFIAYLLRSEMLLLTLPFVFMAILIKWVITGKDFKRYLITAVALLLAVGLGLLSNKAGYSSKEWQEFYSLFDARTELYDFQYIPEYEGNEAFYESIGLSASEQNLLVNYNYGLDEEINADILRQIAQYASSTRALETPFKDKLKEATSLYIYRLTHAGKMYSYQYPMTDFPLNGVVIIMYLMVIAFGIFFADSSTWKDKAKAIGLLALLFACRTTLWLFIIIRGRDPIRITHPLYICEMLILFGMILMYARTSTISEALKCIKEKKNSVSRKTKASVLKVADGAILLMLLLVTFCAGLTGSLQVIESENSARNAMRVHYDALQEFFIANPDSFYFVDVYTSISVNGGDEKESTYSEKMFKDVDNSLQNHDICGGWVTFSPLYRQKLQAFGYDNIETALLTDNAYFVQDINEDVNWLTEYYSDRGKPVTITLVDTVGGVFGIYKLSGR